MGTSRGQISFVLTYLTTGSAISGMIGFKGIYRDTTGYGGVLGRVPMDFSKTL